MLTSDLGVSVPVCTFCFVSVLQGSHSGSCLGVLHLRGLGDLLSEGLEAAAGTEGALGAGFSFLAANCPTPQRVEQNFSMFGEVNYVF